MPFEDLIADLTNVGAEGRGWRSIWAILGLLIGAGIGGWIGLQTGMLTALGYGVVGAGIGWFCGVLFRGAFRVAALTLLIAIPVLAWFWLTGGN